MSTKFICPCLTKNKKYYIILLYKRKTREKKSMYVTILSSAAGALEYRLLDNKLNELIETSGCFLFSILCGCVEGEFCPQTLLGIKWGKENGAPILCTHEQSEDDVFKKILNKTDYAIFVLNGDVTINNLFMKYKMTGKHGSVIKINRD